MTLPSLYHHLPNYRFPPSHMVILLIIIVKFEHLAMRREHTTLHLLTFPTLNVRCDLGFSSWSRMY